MVSNRLSANRNSSKFFKFFMLSGRELNLFPASINFRIRAQFPRLFGNRSIALSLNMSHPKLGANERSETVRTAFALKLNINNDGNSPNTSGTSSNAFAKKNARLRLVKSFTLAGSDRNLFPPALRNSSRRRRPTLSGNSSSPQLDTSSDVTSSSSPDSIARNTAAHLVASSPSISA